jgi:hypothetical protein
MNWDSPRRQRVSRDEFVRNLNDSGLSSRQEINKMLQGLAGAAADGAALANLLTTAGKLTGFQAEAI